MHVSPITCLRPLPEHVAEFAALPYDVFTDAEAREYVRKHPTSFLAIDRPETSFEEGHDPYAPEVYARASELLRERQLDRTLVRDEKPCFYIYEQSTQSHRQIGLMGAIAADDYADNTIRQHELTLSAKEEDRVRHIEAVRAQTGPVFLAYPDSEAINVILNAAMQGEPLYDFCTSDGVRQRVWRIAREVAVGALSVAFSTIDRAYIADGHHRAAAAVRICQKRRAEGRQDDPAEEFLGVLFPASQLQILAYDRVVRDTAGMTEDELLERIEAAGFSVTKAPDDTYRPANKGTFGMYAFGTWHLLTWGQGTNDLDVAVLQDNVLDPILGIEEPRSDARISFVGNGTKDELERLAGDAGMAFALFPTSIEELMAISDAGGLMPPKSTWFEPKLLSGLAIRRIW
ncbi:MAG: DUF1015 domain-containing protein [Atopobiaceae bacterium]|nr:DUF1015 domain-containing protein [Atopobiaceae bacterium]